MYSALDLVIGRASLVARRLGRPIGVGVVAASLSSACSGGTGSREATPVLITQAAAALGAATLTIEIPKAGTVPAALARTTPQYISAATTTASIVLASPPIGFVQPGSIALPLGSSNAAGVSCPASAQGYTCTIPVRLPIGSDTIVVETLDASGDVLSAQKATYAVAAGRANGLPIVLDAQVASATCPSPSIVIGALPPGATGAECSGASTSTITLSGTGPFTFPVSLLDAATRSIAPTVPGAPVLSAAALNDAFAVQVTQNPYALKVTPTGTAASGSVSISAAGLATGDGVAASSFTIAFAIAARMNTGIATTVAGNGTAGAIDGPAASSEFNGPESIVVAPDGSLYVADTNANRIRKISGGVVSTFAGNGTAGHVDGSGAASEFSAPSGITIDAAGNLFVADGGAYIRKITPTGVVSTFAGSGTSGFANGQGTAATFNGAYDVKADRSGNLYVADSANDAIRKITPQGAVTTFAGQAAAGFTNGSGTVAQFRLPSGVGVDPSGNVFVADSLNHAIREITPAGLVTTVAGDGTLGFANGTASSARFNNPTGVIVDVFGNVFVADLGNNVIRKIASGTVSTLAGGPTGKPGFVNGTGTAASFNQPIDVAVDANDNVFVADSGNNVIREIH